MSGPKVETYRYCANFALGLCEGEIAGIRRVWADGNEIDTTGIEMRVHRGSEDQPPDPLIEARQGAGNTPAYRGLAYVVFERLPLDDYGNRIPVLQFEIVRPVGRLERELRAVTVIPGLDRARLRSPRRHRGRRPRKQAQRQPERALRRERLAGLPRRVAGPLPEAPGGGAGGRLVRQRSEGGPLRDTPEGRGRVAPAARAGRGPSTASRVRPPRP